MHSEERFCVHDAYVASLAACRETQIEKQGLYPSFFIMHNHERRNNTFALTDSISIDTRPNNLKQKYMTDFFNKTI